MAYIASVKRLVAMMDNPEARVLVALDDQPYVDLLLNAIRQRIDEGAEPWHGALLFLLAEEVRFPNGAVLTFKAIEDIEKAYEHAGRQWTYMLYSRNLADDVREYMTSKVRAVGSYEGKVGFEQFEEWRDNPLVIPKESDDEAML